MEIIEVNHFRRNFRKGQKVRWKKYKHKVGTILGVSEEYVYLKVEGWGADWFKKVSLEVCE